MATVTNTYTTNFTASVVGDTVRAGVDQTFSNIRSGAGTTTYNDFLWALLWSSTTTNQFGELDRPIILFDTSSIPVGATILSASLLVVGNYKSTDLGTTDLILVSSNPASTGSIVAADYSTLGTTSFGSIASGSFSVAGTNSISLNASGLSNITKNGISKFGLILGWDQSGTFSGTWGSVKDGGYSVNRSSITLAVSYSVSFPTLSFNNVSSLSNLTTIATT